MISLSKAALRSNLINKPCKAVLKLVEKQDIEVGQGFVLLPTSVTGPQGLFCLFLFPRFVYNNLSLKAGGVLEDGCFELF